MTRGEVVAEHENGRARTERVRAMQTRIDELRAASEARFQSVMADRSTAPALELTGRSAEQLERLIADAVNGTVVISFHTQAYFLLLLLLEKLEIDCTAITNAGIARKLERAGREAPRNIEFTTRLTPSLLKRCIKQKRPLFIMADVFIPYGTNAPMALLGRALRYTISWAELAVRFQMSVLLGLVSDKGASCEICLEDMGGGHADPYLLAQGAFDRFGEFLEAGEVVWENLPALADFGYHLPRLEEQLTPELQQSLFKLARCDRNVSRALMKELRGHGT